MKNSRWRTKAVAVAAAVVLAYAGLFVSGAYYHFYIYSGSQSLGNQSLTFNGPYPNADARMSNVTLTNGNGRVVFFYMFRFSWLPFGNYTGELLFDGLAPLCPEPGLVLSSLDILYQNRGIAAPELFFTPSDFASYHVSVVSDVPFPQSFHASYSGLQSSYPDDCGGIDFEFVTVPYELNVAGIHNSTFAYEFTLTVIATINDIHTSATPFIGQSYTGTLSVPFHVNANGTVTQGL